MIPASTRSVEVLPAPLRPTMPTVSPGVDPQRDAGQRLRHRQLGSAPSRAEPVTQLLERATAVAAGENDRVGVVEHDLARRSVRCSQHHRQLALASPEHQRPQAQRHGRSREHVDNPLPRSGACRSTGLAYRVDERRDRVDPPQQRSDRSDASSDRAGSTLEAEEDRRR